MYLKICLKLMLNIFFERIGVSISLIGSENSTYFVEIWLNKVMLAKVFRAIVEVQIIIPCEVMWHMI